MSRGRGICAIPFFHLCSSKPRSCVRPGAYYAENFIVGRSMARRRWDPDPPDVFVLHNSVGIAGGTGYTVARNFAPYRNAVHLENRISVEQNGQIMLGIEIEIFKHRSD